MIMVADDSCTTLEEAVSAAEGECRAGRWERGFRAYVDLVTQLLSQRRMVSPEVTILTSAEALILERVAELALLLGHASAADPCSTGSSIRIAARAIISQPIVRRSNAGISRSLAAIESVSKMRSRPSSLSLGCLNKLLSPRSLPLGRSTVSGRGSPTRRPAHIFLPSFISKQGAFFCGSANILTPWTR